MWQKQQNPVVNLANVIAGANENFPGIVVNENNNIQWLRGVKLNIEAEIAKQFDICPWRHLQTQLKTI